LKSFYSNPKSWIKPKAVKQFMQHLFIKLAPVRINNNGYFIIRKINELTLARGGAKVILTGYATDVVMIDTMPAVAEKVFASDAVTNPVGGVVDISCLMIVAFRSKRGVQAGSVHFKSKHDPFKAVFVGLFLRLRKGNADQPALLPVVLYTPVGWNSKREAIFWVAVLLECR
jgi:hypothetical protein